MSYIYVGTNLSISTPSLLQEMILTYFLAYVYHLSPDFLSFTQIMFPLRHLARGHTIHGPEDTIYMATYLLFTQPDMATSLIPITVFTIDSVQFQLRKKIAKIKFYNFRLESILLTTYCFRVIQISIHNSRSLIYIFFRFSVGLSVVPCHKSASQS